ncbi:MAG TPA: hypothetical protein VLI06_02325 [Solimonas sp.]|nr:hypothetical protein [Solimonas sp.]
MAPLLLLACSHPDPAATPSVQAQAPRYDPLAYARADRQRDLRQNPEPTVPPQCYTRTGGESNPCWTCHTRRNGGNLMGDVELQTEYAFSDVAKDNHWRNLYADRRAAMGAISDGQVLQYVRQDNYAPLRAALLQAKDYLGWTPDLDFDAGFDAEGFARDGSWWRAFRYKPFPGTFWPTNGATDDVMIRLPRELYLDAGGKPSRELYRLNLAILEVAVATPDSGQAARRDREVEPVSEELAGWDLDGDGRISGKVTRISQLPERYVTPHAPAGMSPEARQVRRWRYPLGTEFLHTVRYLDPDASGMISRRMKEVRYAIKLSAPTASGTADVYQAERLEKERGNVPLYSGHSETGLYNSHGWKLQGFIEDRDGALRLQTTEETYYCMGCHTSIGVTVDSSFAFPRKPPGLAGWGYQSLVGMPDVPQVGHRTPETLLYLQRVRGGDEFRANDEIVARFFGPEGLRRDEVLRAAKGGDQDLRHLVMPSRARALALNKAYLALVREQSFILGRDPVLQPVKNVHDRIENGDTGLKKKKAVYDDGRLWLDW